MYSFFISHIKVDRLTEKIKAKLCFLYHKCQNHGTDDVTSWTLWCFLVWVAKKLPSCAFTWYFEMYSIFLYQQKIQ